MKCPKCGSELKKIKVKIEDIKTPAISYQCSYCGYYNFESESTKKAMQEIKNKAKNKI